MSTVDGTVCHPFINLAATCTDTGVYGCSSIIVEACPVDQARSTSCTPLTTETGASIGRSVDVSAMAGRIFLLRFRAVGAAGLTGDGVIYAAVETGPHLVFVDELPG